MNKAFTRESEGEDNEDDAGAPALPRGLRNYMTPQGHAALR
ncbi:MAG: transcription elongation factor GreB, partial [Betaproteobacteria bacterium]|nr:transcription elongation factor GreB [Betaproteobacteria bacterium]